MSRTARWFRVRDGRWHLVTLRWREENGRRRYGAACGPGVGLRLHDRPREVRQWAALPYSGDRCTPCVRAYRRQPPAVRRLLTVRRTVCGPDCGGWIPREPDPDLPVPCGGYHRNKRLFCEADARWAITYIDGPPAITSDANGRQPFFRCTYCARGYRDGLYGNFAVEKLMDAPPKALVAA